MPKLEVDEWWKRIRTALDQGALGALAKVSTARPNPNSIDPDIHVICIYTYDYDDLADVRRVRESLRLLGATWKMSYKSDQATSAGQYRVRGNTRVSMFYE